jgi:hypothetical protein
MPFLAAPAADFETQCADYYEALRLPLDVDSFIASLQQELRDALGLLDQGLPKNRHVQIRLFFFHINPPK